MHRNRLDPKVSVSVVFVTAMFMSIMDSTIVNVALPSLARQFRAHPLPVGGRIRADVGGHVHDAAPRHRDQLADPGRLVLEVQPPDHVLARLGEVPLDERPRVAALREGRLLVGLPEEATVIRIRVDLDQDHMEAVSRAADTDLPIREGARRLLRVIAGRERPSGRER